MELTKEKIYQDRLAVWKQIAKNNTIYRKRYQTFRFHKKDFKYFGCHIIEYNENDFEPNVFIRSYRKKALEYMYSHLQVGEYATIRITDNENPHVDKEKFRIIRVTDKYFVILEYNSSIAHTVLYYNEYSCTWRTTCFSVTFNDIE